MADLVGFYNVEAGYHSGGVSLHKWSRDNRLHPFELFIAWVETGPC